MKPYGVNNPCLEHPDIADIHKLGLKSSVGHIRSKGGDIRSNFKSSDAKRRIRRYFKKLERRRLRKDLTT